MRRTNLWTYFLSLICAAALTLVLLPACGGSSSEGCNTPLLEQTNSKACDIEEDAEEIDAADEELDQENNEESGDDEEDNDAEEEGFGDLEEETSEIDEGVEELNQI